MTKRYTPFRLILLLALFVIPYLLRANGDPTNPPTSGPKDPDLSALRVGHCNPITLPVVNCATQQIELSAYVSWTFSGLLEPIVATWNTGQVAHKITITNADLPGQWNWDASGTGCEPNHWNTDYNQPGTFFTGDLVLESFGAICPGESTVIDVESGGYDFPNYNWSPPNPTGQLTPYEIFAPGNYSLTVVDQIGCPFTEQINIPLSPTVNPVLSGTPQMCPEGDTGMVQVNQMWNAYMWGNGQTTNSIVITEPGLYEVTVTNNFGCTGVGLFGVLSGEVGAFPISMTAPAICVGQPDTLRVVGGYSSYMWSNNVSGITNIVTQPGTYTVTVTNFIGCTGTGSVTVAPLPTPTIAITTTPFCPGDTSTLTVTGGNFPNYSWSGGQTGNPIIATQPGTYTVTVSGATICATSTNVALVQNPAPTTTIANPAQLNCSLPQTMIDAGGTSSGPQFSYTWTTVGGNFVSGQDSLTPVVNAAGTYTLVTTNTTTGCTSSASVTVTSDMQAPPAPAGNPATLTCAVTNFNIGPALPPADTTLLPVWSTVGGNIVSGQNSWNPNVDAPGTYILTVTNPANNCTSTASVLISEDVAAPNSLIAPPSQLTCTMNTVALDGSGSSSGPNFNYQWSTLDGTISGNTNTAVSAAASVGTYTLLVTNSTNGCTATSSVTVTADVNIPNVGAAAPATLTCTLLSVQIDATQSSSGPTFTYTWTGPSIIAGQGTLQPTVDAPGTYVLQLLNTANNCAATLSVVVPQDILPPTANAGQNATLNCVVPTLNLDGTASSTGPNFTYQWTTANGNIVSGAAGLTPTVDMAGTYILQVTNQTNGCISTASVQVMNDASAPMAAIAPPAILTCATLQTIIDATTSSQGPTYNYTWSGPSITAGQGTLQPTVDQPGVYTLDIVNTANGCTDTETITVTQDIVAPTALAGNDGIINCTSPTGMVGSASNPTGPNFTLLWTTPDGNIIPPANGPTIMIDAPGTYQLLITNNINGCTDTDDALIVADFVAPTIDAGPTFELNCVQTSTVLQGTGSTGPNFTYLWTTTDGNIVIGDNTLMPTVNADGTYDLLITNTQNGCTSTDQVLITQSADVPIATIAQPNTLNCTLTSLNLNANGTSVSPTITYAWSTSNGNISNGPTTLTPTIDAPGVYTLLVTDNANNCTSVASITVLENIQNPVVNAGNDNTLNCDITDLPLLATIQSSSSPNISYSWSTTNGSIVNGGSTANPTIDGPGIYDVLVTDAINGCTGTDAVEIFEDVVPPTASIAQPQVLTCDLTQTQIDGTASSQGANFTYAWTTPDGNILLGNTSNQPTVDDPGTYNLLVTNTTNGCTQTATVVVPEDVVPPVAEAGQTVGLDCDTQTNTLDGSASSQGANFTYAWSTADGQIVSGGNTLSPQIGDPGTYVLTVENTQNGCVTTDNVLVTEDVNPPVFSIAAPQLLTCVTTATPLAASGTGFGNSPTYTWTTANGNIVSGGNTLTANVDAPGTYTLTIVNTQNGCTDVEQVQVTENIALPPVQTQPVPPLTCSVLQRTLTATVPAQASVQWSTQNGNIVSGANTTNPVVNEPGLYLVLVTSQVNGCTNTSQVTVQREQNIPTGLEFTLDPPLCNGTPGFLTVDQIDGGIGPFEYSIDGGDTFFPAQDIDNLEPGTYDLVIQDANGCTITQTVPVPAPPTPAVSLPPSFQIVLGENQELEAIVPPSFPLALIDQVIWEPTTGLTFEDNPTIPELLNPVAMPYVTTEYKVIILTKEGCRAESRTIVRVDRDIDIYAPNVIWPDDPDSNNNAFTLFTRPNSVTQILSLQVYDRWGEQLFVNNNFEPDQLSLGWPGTYKGEYVNPGVFVWWAEVELIDGQKVFLKGDVTVVR